ncbi:MAG: MaoC family dehydratase N-terminal domain-containing protein [Dehalococcoidia bacterium]
MTSPTRFAFDSLSRGDVLPTVDLTITAEDVRAYLDATGESADHWPDRVPPVMMSALMLATLLGQVEIPQGVMHTGQEHECLRPVRVGEPLTVTVLVSSYAVRRGALMAAFDAEARAGDEVVAVSRASVLVPPADGAAASDGTAE